MGRPGIKTFLCPLFHVCRKQTSFKPPDLPWVPMGRFKQLLIKEGRGWGNLQSTRNNSAALGQSPGSPSRDIHNNIFELFCRHWNPHQVEEVNCLLASTSTPHLSEPEGWWCWLPITSSSINQKNVHKLTKPSWNITINPSLPFPGQDTQFWGR